MKGRRDEFLLEMYKKYWKNIHVAKNSLWALVPVYFGTLGLLLKYQGRIGINASIIVIIFLSAFFASISINLHLWFIRNVELISRIENEFLNESDFDSIIPKRWVKEDISFFELKRLEPFLIFSILFAIIGIITFLSHLFFIEQMNISIPAALIMGYVLYILLTFQSYKRYDKLLKNK